MNITSVQMPNRSRDTNPIGTIADIMRIIQSGYGIKTDYEQSKLNKLKMGEAENEVRRNAGIFTPEQAGQEYRIDEKSPYYGEAIQGKIERVNPDTNEVKYETFNYVPKERLEKLNLVQSMNLAKEKALLEQDYRSGRLSPKDTFNAVSIVRQDKPPVPDWEKKGWQKKWDLDPMTGKQFTTWLLPSPAGQYQNSLEKSGEAMNKDEIRLKDSLAKNFEKSSSLLSAMKILDNDIKSDDTNATIPGANELINALNRTGSLKLISSGEMWQKPELQFKVIENAGPEAQKLWQNITNYMNKLYYKEAGTAVSSSEEARQMSSMGAHAFSNPTSLKNGIKNAKQGLFDMIRAAEAPYYKNGQPLPILRDYWKTPGAIGSSDPFFTSLKKLQQKNSKSSSEMIDELYK